MYESDAILLNDFIKTRNLSSRTKHGYKDSLKKYTSFQNDLFINLLKEADQEEENGIRWKNRKLKQRLIDFRIFLYENFMITTAKVHFQRILTLYRHFEIEIHELPKLSVKSCKQSKPITFEDLPTKEIIRNAVEISNPVMRAIILFMSSSGCARRETLNLTIQDFIDASYEYHNKKDIKEALLILKELDNVVPTFRIRRQKTNKFYFTFCSPEASNEVVNYLLNNRKLNSKDKLFKINLDYLNNNFTKINNELGIGKVGKYNKFRSHMLRKFHASSLYNAENGLNLEEIDALQGRKKDNTHSSYFMENPYKLKNKYINVLNEITIRY
ncbi:MAG: site-specific integrase [Methanobrevibacter ruminantium]|uniref:site-specific integrase n=1 Tax=Methanobrevibacter ruminantium TaxID=83816 RepID=UPI002D7F78DA|nr:site-specific integrase [Methanobrevibacter ruminantium]MCI5737252.1 site-specific integrase [Methanobrevibacter ruminantium]